MTIKYASFEEVSAALEKLNKKVFPKKETKKK